MPSRAMSSKVSFTVAATRPIRSAGQLSLAVLLAGLGAGCSGVFPIMCLNCLMRLECCCALMRCGKGAMWLTSVDMSFQIGFTSQQTSSSPSQEWPNFRSYRAN